MGARRSVTALASLFYCEVRESQHEPFRSRAAAPWDLERAAAVRKKGKGARRDRFRTARTDLAAEHSAERGADILKLDADALRDGIELEGVHGDVRASERLRLEHVHDVRQLDPDVEPRLRS